MFAQVRKKSMETASYAEVSLDFFLGLTLGQTFSDKRDHGAASDDHSAAVFPFETNLSEHGEC